MNVKTQIHIHQNISHLGLPDKYIGVHIRREDKIISQEMHETHLDKYINTILNINHTDKQTRYQETLNVLLDMDILIQSSFFISTYTSCLSQVAPFFIGLDKCISLDNDWNIINSMNGM